MIKHMEFGDNWSDYYQKWRHPFSEAEARRRHEARELYTALIERDDGSQLALEFCFADAYCSIFFLDELGRCNPRYTFEPTADGRLFLCETSGGQYLGDSRTEGESTLRAYTQDGRMKTLLSTLDRRLVLLGENEPVDVSTHYEPLPEFGEWESLIRRDRSKPAPSR